VSALARQRVEHRRAVVPAPVAREIAPAQVVGEHEQDVDRPPVLAGGPGAAGHGRAVEQRGRSSQEAAAIEGAHRQAPCTTIDGTVISRDEDPRTIQGPRAATAPEDAL
jgi:hypothetical protein